MPEYGSFLELVKGCNLVVDNDTPTKHWEPVSSGRTVAERELTKFVLQNDNKERRTFGYLTPEAVDDLPWGTSGVRKITGGSAPEHGDARTYGFQDDGHVPWLNSRLTRMANSRAVRQNFPFVNRWGNGSGGSGEYVPLIGGPKEVKIPDHLAPILGVVQREVYVTAYTQISDDVWIWAQRRPETALHHPGKLDHVASGFVRHGETRSDAIARLVSEEMDGGRNLSYNLKWHKPVSYFTIRGDDAGQLKGLAEAGLQTCRSAKMSCGWVPLAHRDNDGVGTHIVLSPERVRDTLLEGEWKPGSALAMLRFLVDMGVVNEENEPQFDEIYRMLFRKLPHWMAKGTFPYA